MKKAPIILLITCISIFFGIPYVGDLFVNKSVIQAPYQTSIEAKELHKSLFIIDLHSDVLMNPRSILKESAFGHVDIPRLIRGNVAIQSFTTVSRSNFTTDLHHVPSDSFDVMQLHFIAQGWPVKTWDSPQERTLHQAKLFSDQAGRSQGKLHPIRNQEDLESYIKLKAGNTEITAGFLGIEGLHALEGDLKYIQIFYDAGYRMMAPVHFFDNKIGGSAHGINKGGLTQFGVDVLREMEKLSITLDLSHASPALIDDALKISSRAILVSHTGVKGTCDSPRNLSDKHLEAIAQTGGVIGIGFFEMALCGEDIHSLVQAIRYTSDLVGIDHVGLGSDFDGMVTTVFDSSGFILLTEALLQDGFSHDDIRKIMGGNTLRVLHSNLPG
jgi:membrane dipeptidase